jgi:hypothetical protein
MHSSFIALALLVAPVFGAPATRIQVQKAPGAKEEGSYIVKLKEGVNKKLTLAWLQNHLGANSTVTYDYESNVGLCWLSFVQFTG